MIILLIQKRGACQTDDTSLFFLHSHAGGDTESGCDSGEDSDDDVEDFTPEGFVRGTTE